MKDKNRGSAKSVFLVVLLLALASHASAQNSFDTTGFPQWAKDLRRFEIVAFGSYPFTIFFATTGMDLYRWNAANGMDLNDLRYAPWPLKSTGAVEMDKEEYKKTMIIAAGASVAVALVDYLIVQIKRNKARRIAARIPVGTTTIIKKPWPEVLPDEDGGTDAGALDETETQEIAPQGTEPMGAGAEAASQPDGLPAASFSR
jgi:hypothetical protein